MAGGADITSPGRGMVTLTFTSALLFNGEIRLNAKSMLLTPIAANICFFITPPPQTYGTMNLFSCFRTCYFDTREEILLNKTTGQVVRSKQDEGFLCYRYDSMHVFLSQGTIHLGSSKRYDLSGP
jgi:hypothetical protein